MITCPTINLCCCFANSSNASFPISPLRCSSTIASGALYSQGSLQIQIMDKTAATPTATSTTALSALAPLLLHCWLSRGLSTASPNALSSEESPIASFYLSSAVEMALLVSAVSISADVCRPFGGRFFARFLHPPDKRTAATKQMTAITNICFIILILEFSSLWPSREYKRNIYLSWDEMAMRRNSMGQPSLCSWILPRAGERRVRRFTHAPLK